MVGLLPAAASRSPEIIALVGLEEKADERARRLSGGQRRRLDVGLALVGDPELIFLDEPTTGFDPVARRAAWSVIAGLRDLGKTVFLTTHYLEEAQALADRVAIIKAGVIVAEGPPAQLGAGSAVTRDHVRRRPPASTCAELPGGPGDHRGRTASPACAPSCRPACSPSCAAGRPARGIELERLAVTRPTLEDVYLELVESAEAAEAGGA